MVHQAVSPIKISVVHHQHYGKGQPKPGFSIFMNIRIKSGMDPDGFNRQKKQWYKRKKRNGEQRIPDLPHKVFGFRVPGLYFFTFYPSKKHHIKKQVSNTGYQKITPPYFLPDCQICRNVHHIKDKTVRVYG